MDISEKKINSETVYSGVIVDVTLDDAKLVSGKTVKREVVHHPGGAAVIPIDDEGFCHCVRQYRYPMQRMMLEVPAGKLDKGEDPKVCAERELSEETGLSADELIYLGAVCTSPGFSDERLHIYLALGLHPGETHPDEDEFLNVEKHRLDELLGMVMSGEIEDAKTVIAVLKAHRMLNK